MFNKQELKHYKDVIIALRERNLEPVVTLHHFTNPLWFAKSGGWQNKQAREYFLRYVQIITEALCENVRYWVNINEPLVYVYHSYILGIWPPQETSFSKAKKVKENLFSAHISAYRLIHNIYRRKNLRTPWVGIAKNTQAFMPCSQSLRNRFAVYLRSRWFNFEFVQRLIRAKSLDFIGINYYTRSLVDVEGWRFKNLLLDTCRKDHSHCKKILWVGIYIPRA